MSPCIFHPFAITLAILTASPGPQPLQPPAVSSPPAPPALPAPPPETPAEDPELLARLESIDAYAAGVNELTAAFEQRRHTPLLKKPLVSSGKVRLKGSTIRWDTASPNPSVLIIDGASLRIYYPDQHALEVYPIASGLARLAATPLPRLGIIREQFSIQECKVSELDGVATDPARPAVAILLLPKGDELKKNLREVRVLLDEPPHGQAPAASTDQRSPTAKPYGVARQVEVTDADGDRTVVVFQQVRVNPGLKDEDLELSVPPGTRTSHPFDAPGQGNAPNGKQPKE